MALKVWTAQYRYSGKDRFDITVKGKDHMSFAPSWDIVMGIKNNKITKEEYKEIYTQMMRDSYKKNYRQWINLLNMEEVTLVCFCKKNTFCHRYILADILTKLGANYMGER